MEIQITPIGWAFIVTALITLLYALRQWRKRKPKVPFDEKEIYH